jgi:RIO kinase 1
MSRITKEKFKTYANVFDNFTHRNLFKLASQGHFDELKSPIQVGKEANVFTAQKKDGTFVAVKIYRLENCNFNQMYDYIKADTRYMNLKKNRRDIIFSWTQREYRNIMKAREAKIRVPKPITIKDNIIVMELIGKTVPSKQLKDDIPQDVEKSFNTIIKYIKLLWQNELVHGDLSQFNILNDNDRIVFIDFSQGLMSESYIAKEYLLRDLTNVCNFYAKKANFSCNIQKLYKEILEIRKED